MEELYVFNSDFGMKCHFKKTKYGSRGGRREGWIVKTPRGKEKRDYKGQAAQMKSRGR